MTNRAMVKGGVGTTPAQRPNTPPLPPMPATEDGAHPTTREEPVDSPQPNASVDRAAPGPDKQGLATRR